MDLEPVFHWCTICQHPVYTSLGNSCPVCGGTLKYQATDARPVFARERRILQFYGHGPLTTDAVWRASKSRYYYVNGTQVTLPHSDKLKHDIPAIADYIRDSDHYDALDQQLIRDYRQQLEVNRPHLLALEDEAFQFIQHTVNRFSRRTTLVSFSGGKDSTVVSDLVRRALGRSDVLHVFGDTTLEDEHTYDYVRTFQEQNPLIPFFNAKAEHNFHELVEEMGPPSKVMRWCCTIFVTTQVESVYPISHFSLFRA